MSTATSHTREASAQQQASSRPYTPQRYTLRLFILSAIRQHFKDATLVTLLYINPETANERTDTESPVSPPPATAIDEETLEFNLAPYYQAKEIDHQTARAYQFTRRGVKVCSTTADSFAYDDLAHLPGEYDCLVQHCDGPQGFHLLRATPANQDTPQTAIY